MDQQFFLAYSFIMSWKIYTPESWIVTSCYSYKPHVSANIFQEISAKLQVSEKKPFNAPIFYPNLYIVNDWLASIRLGHWSWIGW